MDCEHCSNGPPDHATTLRQHLPSPRTRIGLPGGPYGYSNLLHGGRYALSTSLRAT
jgi:hypothetical protein